MNSQLYSEDNERAVLSACLIDPLGYSRVRGILTSDRAFHDSRHTLIFKTMKVLFESGIEIDVRTVATELERRKHIDAIGGELFLTQLYDSHSTSAHVIHYANEVRRRWMAREIRLVAQQAIALIDDGQATVDIEAFVGGLIDRMVKAHALSSMIEIVSLQNEYGEIISQLEDEAKHPERNKTISTGIPLFDYKFDGFRPGDLVMIAAPPSMGKSDMMMNLAFNASKNAPVAMFSAEMSQRSVVIRMIAQFTGIDSRIIRRGQAKFEDGFYRSGFGADRKDVWIDPTSQPSAIDVRAKCASLVSQKRVRVVFIDHKDLMKMRRVMNSDAENKNQITVDLKSVARDYDITLVVLSQVTREAAAGGSAKMSQIRWGGEAPADVIITLHRKNYQLRSVERDLLKASVCKAREGLIGPVWCYYWPQTGKIAECEEQDIKETQEESSEDDPF